MRLTIDDKEGQVYIKLRNEKVHKTIEFNPEKGIFVDVDKNNRLIGVELLDISKVSIKDFENVIKKYHEQVLTIINMTRFRDVVQEQKQLVTA
jgi:uncharacterized protein YuzE